MKSRWAYCLHDKDTTSRPAWGAWIEMLMMVKPWLMLTVAPRMGRVD